MREPTAQAGGTVCESRMPRAEASEARPSVCPCSRLLVEDTIQAMTSGPWLSAVLDMTIRATKSMEHLLPGFSKLRDSVPGLQLVNYASLLELRVYVSISGSDVEPVQCIEMLIKSQIHSDPVLRATFTDTRHLSLKEAESGVIGLSGFTVDYVGDRQLEGVSWHVYCLDSDRIEFFAGQACVSAL